MKYKLIQRLQNSPFTRWWWTYWQHNIIGRIVIIPWYKTLDNNWTKCNFKD